jgi:hypothetical protein
MEEIITKNSTPLEGVTIYERFIKDFDELQKKTHLA